MNTKWNISRLAQRIFTLVALSVGIETYAGPTYMVPKGVEPKITQITRPSGLRVVKREWVALSTQVTVWEIGQARAPKDKKQIFGEVVNVVTIVKQNVLGMARRWDYIPESGLTVTIDHPTEKGSFLAYRIERNDKFVDGFDFTAQGELEPFSDERIKEIKRRDDVINKSP